MSRSKLGAAQSASSRLKRHPSSFQKPGTGPEKGGDGWAEVHLSTLSKFRCFRQEIERRREIAQFSFFLQIFCLCWRSWQQVFWGKSNYIRFNEVHDIKLCSKDCTQLHQNSAAAQVGVCLSSDNNGWLSSGSCLSYCSEFMATPLECEGQSDLLRDSKEGVKRSPLYLSHFRNRLGWCGSDTRECGIHFKRYNRLVEAITRVKNVTMFCFVWRATRLLQCFISSQG